MNRITYMYERFKNYLRWKKISSEKFVFCAVLETFKFSFFQTISSTSKVVKS